MKDLIDELPGLDLPVGEVTDRLELMWDSDASGSPSAFRASQMNVVLHFGWDVTAEQAQERFTTLLTFAQRYPHRVRLRMVRCERSCSANATLVIHIARCVAARRYYSAMNLIIAAT